MNKQIRKEVEMVLGRELIGIEKLWQTNLTAGGMVNPVDIASTILKRHIENENRRIASIQNDVIELEKQLRVVRDWTGA